MIRLAIAITLMAFLSGCVTVTAPPREQNVVYTATDTVDTTSALANSVSVGEVSGFPGISHITLRFKLASNLNDKQFEEYVNKSLQNAGLYGEGYILNAELINSNDWSDGVLAPPSIGELSRNLEVKYTLLSPENEIVFSEIIEGKG